MLVPKYLQEISESVEVSKKAERIKIKCNCGCSNFYVYESVDFCNQEIKTGFNEIIREDDKLYLVKRNFFGKIIKRIECGNMFSQKPRKMIQVRCKICSKNDIIFDNYKHGYNAVMDTVKNNDVDLTSPTKFKLCYSQPIEVYLKIYQDISYDEFYQEFNDLDFETYLCSFTNIDIYGIDSKLKTIRIYSEETT